MSPQIAQFLPYVLGAAGVLIVAVGAGVVLMIKNAQKKNDPSQLLSGALKQQGVLQEQFEKYKGAAGEKKAAAEARIQAGLPHLPDKPGLLGHIRRFLGIASSKLEHSFKDAIGLLREKIPGRDFRYRVPWFVMMGESAAGKTTLMNSIGLPQPFGQTGGDPFEIHNAVTWWMFTNGIVLDVDGSMVASHDGRKSDEGAWHSFLGLVRRHRPERPVDGIIIAIPAADLVGPNKLSPEDLRRKADLLYEKIWAAQKATGMTFPVYIFITKCDKISGFRSYVHELPKNLWDDMFGWSNPYSVHSAYIPDWVDEAFSDINSAIYKLQIEVFAENESVEDSDGVFMFPSEFQTLVAPVRIYLNHLFKESAYHESFMFRGLYFCGDTERDAPVSTAVGGEYAPAAGEVQDPKPVFLKHVFEKKIFPEYRLARPVSKSILARNRLVLAGQLACLGVLVLGGFALWLSSLSLQRAVTSFQPVLVEVEKDLGQISDLEKSSAGKLTPSEMLQRLQGVDPTKVLAGMQEINASTLRSVFLPASWFSNLDDRMNRMLILTFNKVVLGSIYLQLNERIQQTLAIDMPPSAAPSDAPPRIVNIAAMPEFQTLKRFVDQMKDLEQYTTMYNVEAAPDSADLPRLGQLVKFIYNTDLPPAFYQHSDYYFRALKASQQETINVDKLKKEVADKQSELAQKFFDALLERDLPMAQLSELRTELEALSQEPTTAGSDPALYRTLMGNIDQLTQTLNKPELAWVGKTTFDGGPEFAQLLDAMQSSTLFGPDAKARLEELANNSFEMIHTALQNYDSSLTGPLLQISDNTVKPSPAILALRKGLEDFLDQKFMAAANGRRIRTTVPQGSRLVWDVTGLQQALQLVEPYNSFASGGLLSFPAELQNRLRVMALNRLEANMDAMISSAQRVEGAISPAVGLDQSVQAETKQLKDVDKPLDDLLSAFDRLGMTRSYNDLAEATLTTAYEHLHLVDQLFSQVSPYAFDQAALTRWQGNEPLVTAAFGVKDEKDLPQYLDSPRENLKHLREYADPALAIITGQRPTRRSTADSQLLAKWGGIATELDKYDNKNPASSVAALESFVGTVMPSLTLDNYMDKISSQDLTAQSGDFFLNRRNELRDLIYERLDSVSTQRAQREYRELETLFNQKLAGKFPFVAGTGKGAESDPASLREFYKLFDDYDKSIVKYLERPSVRNASGTRVLQFLDQITSVRSLFAPFLDDPKAAAPVFDYEVDFRVNRRRETGGNQIIEWDFAIGDHQITERDTNKRGRWLFGDPVALSLRWAKDANIVPAPDDTEGVTYSDKKVTFEDSSRWAILRFIRTYASAPADFDQLVDPLPQTLKFVVPTTMTGDDPMETRVFVRLTLLTADKKDPITLPAFPDRAPMLDR